MTSDVLSVCGPEAQLQWSSGFTGRAFSRPQTHFLQAPLQPECISGISTLVTSLPRLPVFQLGLFRNRPRRGGAALVAPAGRGRTVPMLDLGTVCYACALSVNRAWSCSCLSFCRHLVLSTPLEFPFKQNLQVEFSWTACSQVVCCVPHHLVAPEDLINFRMFSKSRIMPTRMESLHLSKLPEGGWYLSWYHYVPVF